MFDLQVPFFIPLWRRLAVVAFCIGWAVLEWSYGENLWMMVSLAIAAYLAWAFFVTFKPREQQD